MHLIFDSQVFGLARRAPVSRGGIYRYASQLLLALAADETLRIHPFCANPLLQGAAEAELTDLQAGGRRAGPAAAPPRPRKLRQLPEPLKRIGRPLYRRLVESPLLQARARRRLRTLLAACPAGERVFHTPFLAIPEFMRASGVRHCALTLHDMLPCLHPEFFPAESLRQFRKLLAALRPEDHLLCVSESTRSDFLRLRPGFPAEQVHVVPLAAAPHLQPVLDPAERAAMRGALGLAPDERVLLSLCTLEPRKNLLRLIGAFENLRRRQDASGVRLVLAGALGWKTGGLAERIRSSPAREAILVSGHIDDDQLACLYSLADVFVYPSLYEGFGLPPLEAMQCGAPVVAGRTSSLPEVVGEAGLLVDPRSTSELEEAIARLLGSAELRQEFAARGRRRAAGFSWGRSAALTREAYARILGHAG